MVKEYNHNNEQNVTKPPAFLKLSLKKSDLLLPEQDLVVVVRRPIITTHKNSGKFTPKQHGP